MSGWCERPPYGRIISGAWKIWTLREAGAVQVHPREVEHGVAGLVVELVALVEVADVPGNAVVLADAHAAAEHVAGRGAYLGAELAGVDDAEAAVGGQVRALRELALAVGTCGYVVSLFRGHGELARERAVAEHEGGRLCCPRRRGGSWRPR